MERSLFQKNLTIDDYFLRLPEDKRSTLEMLRRTIKAAVSEAIEIISYQIAAFKQQGHLLIGFGASKNYCAFFLMSTSALKVFKGNLNEYDIGKGSIRS